MINFQLHIKFSYQNIAPFSEMKLKVEIGGVKINQCIEQFNSRGIHLTQNQICAGGEPGKDSCHCKSMKHSSIIHFEMFGKKALTAVFLHYQIN